MDKQALWDNRMKAIEENRENEWYKTLTHEEQREVRGWWDIEADAHSCRANADSYGICQVCGAIIPGTAADYEIHGYDPE